MLSFDGRPGVSVGVRGTERRYARQPARPDDLSTHVRRLDQSVRHDVVLQSLSGSDNALRRTSSQVRHRERTMTVARRHHELSTENRREPNAGNSRVGISCAEVSGAKDDFAQFQSRSSTPMVADDFLLLFYSDFRCSWNRCLVVSR